MLTESEHRKLSGSKSEPDRTIPLKTKRELKWKVTLIFAIIRMCWFLKDFRLREKNMLKIGIGYENYKEFVDQKLYYVDKTLLIRDVVEKGGKVTLFTRPRRFGKTLAAIHWREKEAQFKSREEENFELKKEAGRFATSLKTLSECLKLYHGRNVVILIDEYDVPLENAYFTGFYQEMTGFIRSLFESALKTNDALEFAVITGCLRISRESIFTGLNNLEVCSIRNLSFGEYFGFTTEETLKMLADYDLKEKEEEIRHWYDGYLFGNSEVYNPWSVTKYVKDHVADRNWLPEPYWSNTSSNSIIKELVEQASEEQRRELDTLIEGGTIEKQIHEDITYDDIHMSEDNLWNFLFFTGYMRKVS